MRSRIEPDVIGLGERVGVRGPNRLEMLIDFTPLKCYQNVRCCECDEELDALVKRIRDDRGGWENGTDDSS
jgi:hypothetical protein